MKMTKQQAISELNLLISKGSDILKTKRSPNGSSVIGLQVTVDYKLYISWHTNILDLLSSFLPPENHYFVKFSKMERNTFSNANVCKELLCGLVEQIERDFISLEENTDTDNLSDLYRIFSRFHHVARQLRSRHSNRTTLNIQDEYDVQDLLHALLKLFFDDVRTEEWTPSYAGGSSRMDFLLKNEKLVIEVKKSRNSMSDKELGEQLIIDIEKYQKHPDCERLICFIYDPEGLFGNPTGIENDLNSKHSGFAEIMIKP